MRARTVVASAMATLACCASRGVAQGTPTARSLTSFPSDSALAHYLRAITTDDCAGERTVEITPPTPGESGSGDALRFVGTITQSSGEALAGASVFIEKIGAGAITDPHGSYSLQLPAARVGSRDSLTISVRLIGFREQNLSVPVRRRYVVHADFVLCPHPVRLGEVVVTGAGTADEADFAGTPAKALQRSITNTQEASVDEGDIVKLAGDYLVTLRRGRLFTIRAGGHALEPISSTDAFGPGIDPRWTWYDELIVWRDRVVVVGYSYERGGTEIGVFRLDRAGRLQHRATYQLRSYDYYSERNYASRLIGSKLLFYAPLYAPMGEEHPLAMLPAMRKWTGMDDSARWERTATVQHIYRPARRWSAGTGVALHTVTACDLAAEELTCEATVVIAPPDRVFYVSATAAYVWTSGFPHRARATSAPRDSATADSTASMLFRIPLDGSAPSALGVEGAPVDQFSLLESDDGHLNVMLRSGSRGDAMWHAEWSRGDAALFRVPLASFNDGSRAAPVWCYRPIPTPGGYAMQNRFVGDHLLYGTGNGWLDRRTASATLFVVPWRGGDVSEIPLAHSIDRIEVVGRDAVVVGTSGDTLHFSGIRLGNQPRVVQHYALAGSQGELRSHGFFYRADGPNAGVIGLPVRAPGRPGWEHIVDGSASVLLLRSDGETFGELGRLWAGTPSNQNDACRASCVDWYGNARPIFLGDRVLALLGYELVEGRIRGGRIDEWRRVNFTPRGNLVAR